MNTLFLKGKKAARRTCSPEISAPTVSRVHSPELPGTNVKRIHTPEISSPAVGCIHSPEVSSPAVGCIHSPEVSGSAMERIHTPEALSLTVSLGHTPEIPSPAVGPLHTPGVPSSNKGTPRSPESPAALRVGLIGCRGRMGEMLMRRLSTSGCKVHGADLPLTAEILEPACRNADVVLLCVPAAVLRETILRCLPHMPPETILADIVSVKVQPMALMESLWQGPCVGTHPLFGPHPAEDLDLRVCVTPGKNASPRHTALVESLFQSFGAHCFRSTPEEHDRAVALIQSMNFVASAAYFAMLADKKSIAPFITPSFTRRQEAARKLLTEDGELFTGLFEANPFALEAVRQYRNLLNIAAGGDVDLLLQRARLWLDSQ